MRGSVSSNGEKARRVAAAIVAGIAFAGLVARFGASYHFSHSTLYTFWNMALYFSELTNLVVAVVFAGIAADRVLLRANWVVPGTMLSILLVGVQWNLSIAGHTGFSGGSLANLLMHDVTPIMVLLFWIFFVRKVGLKWWYPLLWGTYPLTYLGYPLMRGQLTGVYPYPFLNAHALGWRGVGLVVCAIGTGFLVGSFTAVLIDRRAAQRSLQLAED